MSPKISIVLPTYNGARYIRQSIQSCIDQTFEDWELIIVDDCSTDDTPAIIAEYMAKDHRIRAIRHERNRKLPAALNTGFAQAKGDFLTWTSDDNWYHPEALERMQRFLVDSPTIGLVYCDYYEVEKGDTLKRIHRVKSPEKIVFGCIVGPCFLYRRTVMEQTGEYDSKMFYVEDYDYWLRVATKFLITSHHEILYYYRIHPSALSANRPIDATLRWLDAKERSILAIPWVTNIVKVRAVLKMIKIAWKIKNLSRLIKYCVYYLPQASISNFYTRR